jgi:hypothetical protein
MVKPVMLPPGRARLATKPSRTGSVTIVNTMGWSWSRDAALPESARRLSRPRPRATRQIQGRPRVSPPPRSPHRSSAPRSSSCGRGPSRVCAGRHGTPRCAFGLRDPRSPCRPSRTRHAGPVRIAAHALRPGAILHRQPPHRTPK